MNFRSSMVWFLTPMQAATPMRDFRSSLKDMEVVAVAPARLAVTRPAPALARTVAEGTRGLSFLYNAELLPSSSRQWDRVLGGD